MVQTLKEFEIVLLLWNRSLSAAVGSTNYRGMRYHWPLYIPSKGVGHDHCGTAVTSHLVVLDMGQCGPLRIKLELGRLDCITEIIHGQGGVSNTDKMSKRSLNLGPYLNQLTEEASVSTSSHACKKAFSSFDTRYHFALERESSGGDGG